jgi:hypothetical protein
MRLLVFAIGCVAVLLASVAWAEEREGEQLVTRHYSLSSFELKSWASVKDLQVYATRFDGKPSKDVERPNDEQLAKARKQMLQEIGDLLVNTIEPASWASSTGNGTITITDDGFTIRQSPRVHEYIGKQLYAFYCLQITQIHSTVETYRVSKETCARWMGNAKLHARLLTAEERAELFAKEKPEAIAKMTLVVPNCQVGNLHTPDGAEVKVLPLRACVSNGLKGMVLSLPKEIAASPVKMVLSDAVLVSLSAPESEDADRYVVLVTPRYEFQKYEEPPWEGKELPPGK